MQLPEILHERLLKILSNPDDIDPELVVQVADEAERIVGGRALEQPFVLDIAVYRYLLVKGTLSLEGFEQAYKDALAALAKAPAAPSEDEEGTTRFGVAVGERGALWI